MKKHLKKFILITVFFITVQSLFSQQNHYIILRQDNANQIYNSGKTFPKKWIEDNWKVNYYIKFTNFKGGEWFIVMEKSNVTIKQSYRFRPSSQQINEKLKDGYKIQDICLFVENNSIRDFFVFTKISTNKVSNSFFTGKPNNSLNLINQTRKSINKNWLYQSAKSLKHGNKIRNAGFSTKAKGNSNQVYAHRVDFPNDYIRNKKSQGYYLESITYDNYKSAWFVIMTKKGNNGTSWGNITTNWVWFNYKSQTAKFKEYITTKGYKIIGVY